MAGGIFDEMDRFSRQLFGDAAVDRTQRTVRELYDSTMGTVGGFDGLKAKGTAKVTDLAEQFNAAIPYIERSGYRVIEIEVTMGITPALTPRLMFIQDISKEERTALLEETRGRGLTHAILSSLFKATDWAERGQFADFRFLELAVEVGLLPNVRVKFLREGEQARYGLAEPGTGSMPLDDPDGIPPKAGDADEGVFDEDNPPKPPAA